MRWAEKSHQCVDLEMICARKRCTRHRKPQMHRCALSQLSWSALLVVESATAASARERASGSHVVRSAVPWSLFSALAVTSSFLLSFGVSPAAVRCRPCASGHVGPGSDSQPASDDRARPPTRGHSQLQEVRRIRDDRVMPHPRSGGHALGGAQRHRLRRARVQTGCGSRSLDSVPHRTTSRLGLRDIRTLRSTLSVRQLGSGSGRSGGTLHFALLLSSAHLRTAAAGRAAAHHRVSADSRQQQ
jgi:hypothetical protein